MKLLKDRAATLAAMLIIAAVTLALTGNPHIASAAIGGAIGVAINYSEQG